MSITMAEPEPAPPLSKNAQKRLAREAGADARREKVLQKRRAVRERQKLERAEARRVAEEAGTGPGSAPLAPAKRKQPQVLMSDPRASAVRVALDMSFDHVMSDLPKDVAKLTKQIERCYGDNRRAAHPLQLHITSLAEPSSSAADSDDAGTGSSGGAAGADGGDESDSGGGSSSAGAQGTAAPGASAVTHLQARYGYDSWDVHKHSAHYLELWPKDEIVYLTAESGTVLTTLAPGTTYVIGGFVDHNRCKGLTHSVAQAAGLATVSFRIQPSLQLCSGSGAENTSLC
jgi:tRNA (guanine9-N1)-methyltransferase